MGPSCSGTYPQGPGEGCCLLGLLVLEWHSITRSSINSSSQAAQSLMEGTATAKVPTPPPTAVIAAAAWQLAGPFRAARAALLRLGRQRWGPSCRTSHGQSAQRRF